MISVNPCRWRGVLVHPLWLFLKWSPNHCADRAEISHNLWGILCATFGEKKLTGSGQVTEVWRHKNSLRSIYLGNRVFSHGTCCHWLERRHYAWFRSADDHIRPLVLHLNFLKVIRGDWPLLPPCITIVVNLAVFGVSWGPETEYVVNFSRRCVYSASLYYPMSIRAIDQVCPQVILVMSLTLFPSVMIFVTNIPSTNCNNTLFCLEFNGGHAGERFMSYDL